MMQRPTKIATPASLKTAGDQMRYETAYMAGRSAAESGMISSDNPYPKSPSFKVMRDGWINGFLAGGGRLEL